MNPLTLVKRIQKINTKEADLGISDEASWHAKYKGSAYVFVGGVPYDLTEGDLLAVFSQYGEIVDVNLVRDKATGKSKGFAFIAYEDQRSTNLAVDNLNGAQVLGRIIRVDHVSDYKKKEEEDEETERKKREERGVCRAFQRGQCTRGASCKFSHDEQRAANTGWGAEEDKSSRWRHDKADDSRKPNTRLSNLRRTGDPDSSEAERQRADDRHARSFRVKDAVESYHRPGETDSRDQDRGDKGRHNEDPDRKTAEKRLSRHEPELNSRDDRDRREERRSRRHDIDYDRRDYREGRAERVRESRRGEREERSSHASDSFVRHRREQGNNDCRRP